MPCSPAPSNARLQNPKSRLAVDDFGVAYARVFDEERQEMVEPPAGTRFVLEVGFSSADPEAKKIEWRW